MKNKTGFDKDSISLSLLNFNCFGIGYFVAGLKKRGLIALAGNLVLLVIAQVVNASKQPVMWMVIFLAAFTGMTVDLWLLVRKDQTLIPEKLAQKKYMLLIICVLAALVFFGGFTAYRVAGNKIIDKGEQAYKQDDYLNSYKYLYSADRLYQLSLNPRIAELKPLLNEVSIIVAAQSYSSQSRYQDVVQCVEKMHEFFPQSSKTSFMNEFAIENLMTWADELQADDQYQTSRWNLFIHSG